MSAHLGVFGGVVRVGCGPACTGVCEVDVTAASETKTVALAGTCEVCGKAFARGTARRGEGGRLHITAGGAPHAMHVTALLVGTVRDDEKGPT